MSNVSFVHYIKYYNSFTGEGEFRTPEACDLHLDQSVRRKGVHAYRGAAYLEESTKDDFCFRVLTESHKLHSRFFNECPRAAARSKKRESIRLGQNEESVVLSQWVPVDKCSGTKRRFVVMGFQNGL